MHTHVCVSLSLSVSAVVFHPLAAERAGTTKQAAISMSRAPRDPSFHRRIPRVLSARTVIKARKLIRLFAFEKERGGGRRLSIKQPADTGAMWPPRSREISGCLGFQGRGVDGWMDAEECRAASHLESSKRKHALDAGRRGHADELVVVVLPVLRAGAAAATLLPQLPR
jgi:hypothetical protein